MEEFVLNFVDGEANIAEKIEEIQEEFHEDLEIAVLHADNVEH